MAVLNKCSDIINKIVAYLCAAMVAILTVLTFLGVIWRFLLNNPIVWLYELTLVLFSWIIFLGTTLAFKLGEHISLNFLETKLTGTARYILKQFIYLLCIVFLIVVLKEGSAVVQNTWSQFYNTIPLPKGLFYLSFPTGAAIGIFQLVVNMINLKNH